MPPLRIDHLELTMPRGSLTKEFREEVDAFYCDIFGWTSREHFYAGQNGHWMEPDPRSFILLIEDDEPMQAPSYTVGEELGFTQFVPHIGLLCETDDEVKHLLAECERFRENDDRVLIKDFPVFVNEDRLAHNFIVRYLLPFWFDVHVIQPFPGKEPEKDWRFG
jgi:hypothetical protein